MAEEIVITKKNPRKKDDGHRNVTVRMREELIDHLDILAARTNRSRNELINLLLNKAIDIVRIDEE